jgi:hypothetical protein
MSAVTASIRVERTSRGHRENGEVDPSRTHRDLLLDHLAARGEPPPPNVRAAAPKDNIARAILESWSSAMFGRLAASGKTLSLLDCGTGDVRN